MPPKKAGVASRRPRSQAVVERSILPANFLSQAWSQRRGDEICGACLLGVEDDAEVGLVDNCSHIFHYECVQRWSQTENSCPQCKVRFFWLAAYRPTGKRTSLDRVERKDQEHEDEDSFEEVYICEKCKEVGDENTLLLCDGMHGTCNACFHTRCVGLTEVPRGSWFCPDCTERGFDIDAQGNRGPLKRPATDSLEEEMALPEETATSSTATAPAEGASNASQEEVETLRAELATAAGRAIRRRPQARGAQSDIPSQLRLSSLACVSPAVATPSFLPAAPSAGEGSSASEAPQPQGLFASFAQRRKARRTEQSKSDSAGTGQSFISLAPVYEADFMGSSLK
mmetsp:Transcript_52448/g.125318  ORF Transcript_52448/g.125318 Transcript_52448/m.125318 type:complete len:341 (-) Transcript_52448:120-1142(-)